MASQLRDALKALGFGAHGHGTALNQKDESSAFGRRVQTTRPDSRAGRDSARVVRSVPRNPDGAVAHSDFKRIDEPGSKPTAIETAKAVTKEAGKPVSVAAKPASRLIRVSDFHPHPLFMDDPAGEESLPELACSGIARQLTTAPDNETDLVIGLDFGTSATKIVVRDTFAATGVFPVHFDARRPGVDGFLLPSRVFRTGDVYSLEQGTHRIGDLKLALLGCPASSPVTEFNDCCAFLALVIRRTRAWFFTEHRDTYRGHALNWRINLGLAASSYQNAGMVATFRRLAWAAANLAADREAETISMSVADEYRQLSFEIAAGVDGGDFEFAWSDVDAVPEVSAQLQGFMSSASWDWSSRPVMMLVDVGAGTVDSALFHVRAPASGDGVLTFYSSRVEPNGVINLHRRRVDWLKPLLPLEAEDQAAREYLAAIAKPSDRLRPIPEAAREYLPGYELEAVGKDVDEEFYAARYRAQVAGSINDAKVGKGIFASQLERVPLLLCGGGSRMEFYRTIGAAINDTPGWRVRVEVMRLPVPQELADMGWHSDDFDRLSVAYGLSLGGRGETALGRIVRDIEVPDVPLHRQTSQEDRYLSKDQM